MNHLVTIPKSDISKQDIADIAAGLILRIEEGEVNPIAAQTSGIFALVPRQFTRSSP